MFENISEEEFNNILVKTNNENYIRECFFNLKKTKVYNEKLSELKLKYLEEYSVKDDYLEYIDFENVEVYDADNDKLIFTKKLIYPNFIYEDILTKEIKEVYKNKIENNMIKPTLDIYIKENIENIENILPSMEDINIQQEYIEFIKPVLINKINEQYQTTMDKIKSGYPEAEQQTWYQQYQEALAYKADNTSSIPLISKIATSRGVDINILVDKIIAKYESYSELIGETTGLRQQAEDYINTIVALNDVDEFNNRFKEYVEIFNAKLQEVTEQS